MVARLWNWPIGNCENPSSYRSVRDTRTSRIVFGKCIKILREIVFNIKMRMIDLQNLFSCAMLKRSQRIFSISFLLKYLESVRFSRGHLRASRLFYYFAQILSTRLASVIFSKQNSKEFWISRKMKRNTRV